MIGTFCSGVWRSAAYTAAAVIAPCSTSESAIPAPAPRSSALRWASTSPTASCIDLPRLRHHPQLLHPRPIHHVEHGNHPAVRHALVRLEQRALDSPRARRRAPVALGCVTIANCTAAARSTTSSTATTRPYGTPLSASSSARLARRARSIGPSVVSRFADPTAIPSRYTAPAAVT